MKNVRFNFISNTRILIADSYEGYEKMKHNIRVVKIIFGSATSMLKFNNVGF